MHAVQGFLSLPEKLPQNFMAENNTHVMTAHDWNQVQLGDFSVAGAPTPWGVFGRRTTRPDGLSLAALMSHTSVRMVESWFNSNCHLEHLHVASPAWQFTLTNLKV